MIRNVGRNPIGLPWVFLSKYVFGDVQKQVVFLSIILAVHEKQQTGNDHSYAMHIGSNDVGRYCKFCSGSI